MRTSRLAFSDIARVGARIVFFMAFLVVAGRAFGAQQPTVTGSLPKDPSANKFTLIITGVALPSEYLASPDTTTAEPTLFNSRFQIKFSGTNIDSAALSTTPDPAPLISRPFYISSAVNLLNQDDPTIGHTYKYQVDISEQQSGYLSQTLTANNGALKITVDFLFGSPPAELLNFELTQETYIITEAPTFDVTKAVAGSMERLNVAWNVKDAVNITGGQSSTTAPSSVRVYVVDGDIASQDIDGMKASLSKEADVKSLCHYTAPTGDGPADCVKCDDTNVYLSSDSISKLPGFKTATNANSAGSVGISGLTNDHRYFVFMVYEPSGTKFSQCVAGTPRPNFTLTEINGEGKAEVVDFRCFIATAAYGSPMHADLRLFRKFRDHMLMTNPVGRAFVHYYYRFSPPLANFIARHPRLRSLTRGVLSVPAGLLRAADQYY